MALGRQIRRSVRPLVIVPRHMLDLAVRVEHANATQLAEPRAAERQQQGKLQANSEQDQNYGSAFGLPFHHQPLREVEKSATWLRAELSRQHRLFYACLNKRAQPASVCRNESLTWPDKVHGPIECHGVRDGRKRATGAGDLRCRSCELGSTLC